MPVYKKAMAGLCINGVIGAVFLVISHPRPDTLGGSGCSAFGVSLDRS